MALGAEGASGGITIDTSNLTLTDGARINASTFGRGDAGAIVIDTDDFVAQGENSSGLVSAIFSEVTNTGIGNAGGIRLIASGRVSLLDGALISASTFGQGNAGAIVINTTDFLAQGESLGGNRSNVSSQVTETAVGNSGGISLTASGKVSLLDGALISASTFGKGNAGLVEITATDTIALSGEDSQGSYSAIESKVSSGAEGSSGGITIDTGSLSLVDGAQINASTSGKGNAGKTDIDVRDTLLIEGETIFGIPGGIGSVVNNSGEGNAGGIQITTTDLILKNGAQINASTYGQGNAGAIVINTTDFLAQGESSGGNRSNVSSQVTETAVGNSGGIILTASGNVSLLDGAFLDASTFGQGNAGAIVINTTDFLAQGESSGGKISNVSSQVAETAVGNSGGISLTALGKISLLDGSELDASTFGQGSAGAIVINTTDFLAQGESSGGNRSNVSSQVTDTAVGNAGGISLTASGKVSLLDGAFLDASTSGKGNAGAIVINTTDFLAQGESSSGNISYVGSGVLPGAEGNSGGIILTASGNVSLLDGAFLDASTFGQGNAGAIDITATGDISLTGSGIGSVVAPGAEGASGGITIDTSNLTLTDGAAIDASTGGKGDAGAIDITATEDIFLAGKNSQGFVSGIFSTVAPGAEGASGGITIDTGSLSLVDGAGISASTDGKGKAGAVNIIATNSVSLTGESSQGNGSNIQSGVFSGAEGSSGGITRNIQSGVFSGAEGSSGGITLTTGSLSLKDGTGIFTSTQGKGNAGAISITATDFITLQGQATNGKGSQILSQVEKDAVGNASSISITTPQLSLLDGAVLAADTAGQGDAGSIVVNASQGVNLGQGTKLSVETSAAGTPGDIEIKSPQLTLDKDAQLSATVTVSSTNLQGGGNINLFTTAIDLSGELGIFAETNSTSPAGNLKIQPYGTDPNLGIQFRDNGFISASTTASGNGGSISLTAPETIDVRGQGSIAVTTSGSGAAGNIQFTAPQINLSDGVTVTGSTTGTGIGGTITVDAADRFTLTNATLSASTSGQANAGNITIQAQTLTLNNGSTIKTNTAGSGTAGDINLIATEGLFLSGSNSGIFSSTEEGSTGNAGNITIDPPIVDIRDGAGVAVNSLGSGLGGNITLSAGDLNLTNNAFISALTRSSGGGNIDLLINNNLILQNNSFISTEAGTAEAGGDGGNITIDSKLIVGSSNSDIIANAFEGNGGNITINTQGLFGFTVENTDTPRTNLTSDITASSQFGVSSTPNISQAIDPAQSLAVLDTTVADLSNQIDRRCDLVGTPNASRFVITGKGGLPPNDRNRLSLTPLWTALDLTSDSTDPGHNWYKQGNYAEAIDSWETALQSSDLPLEQQVTLHANLAQAYATQGDWDSATEAIDRGLNRLNHHSNPNDGLLNRLRARLLTTQSYLLTERGQLNQAFNLSEEAHRLYQAQNDRFGILQTQLNQAQILTRQGNLRQASDRLITVQNSLEPTENDSLTAAIDLELGTVQRLLGNYTAAQTALERSEALFSRISPVYQTATRLALGDNDRDQFVPLNRQFNNLQEQIALVPPGSRGELQTRARSVTTVYETISNKALTQYRQAQTTAPTPDRRLQALTQEFLMTIDLIAARRTPDWSAVTVLQEELQDQSSQLPLSSTRLYARLNLAGGVLELQEKNATVVTPEDLTALLAQTLQDADTLGDRRAKTQALNQLARLYEQQQQWDIAQEFNEAALALAQEDGEADLTYRLLWQLGRLQYAQGQTAEAIVSYTESIEILNTLRSDINTANAEVRFSFRDAVDPIYRELVSLLLSQDTPETSRPENVVQARNLIESLQLSELVNFFQTDCDVTNLAQIDELDPHSAVIYPVILSDRLEVIVSLPGQPLKHYATDLPESTLTQAASIIQQELANPFSQRYLPLAQRLYNAIIRPAEADLNTSEIENLVFVLDGPLRNIPMSVLHDGDQFLIEKYAIALTPGLQLLDPQPLQQQEIEVLLAGLTEARQGFAALPNVQAEIDSIGNTVPSDVLLNDIFVEQNLLTAIESSPSPVVHLATHGEFGSTAEDTFILTWDDRFTANEFSQLLQSRSGGQPIELLILSACRTATGDDRAALGLAGIAVRSGARSTLASLWYISDEATSVLMGKLYESLSQQNVTKAEAVRQAQLELLHNPQYANPYYWAPFVLVGNWL